MTSSGRFHCEFWGITFSVWIKWFYICFWPYARFFDLLIS
jgi:hypothetical protein